MSEKGSEIQPVLRAMQVLETLNLQATTTLSQLHEATGLPKSTLVRMLDTLIAGGYVQRISRSAGYQVSERVLQLSGGFRHADRMVEASRPFLSALTAQHKWPMGFSTPDRDQMLVRSSTRAESPFSNDYDYLGRRIAMLLSAMGRAYFAFCSEDERTTLLAIMRNSRAQRNAMARDELAVSRLVAHIRTAGYATTVSTPGDILAGFAVPVLSDGYAVAAITLRYYGSAMTETEAARRFLGPMQQAAVAIAAEL